MNILFLSSGRGKVCGFNSRRPLHVLFAVVVVGLLMAGSGYLGYTLKPPEQDTQELLAEWRADIVEQQQKLEELRERANADVDAMSSRIGLLQANVMRLNALGRKLVTMASIEKSEFDFESPPAVGGPELAGEVMVSDDDVELAIAQLARDLESRENQLLVLENLVLNENLQREVQPSGRPIVKGWISSYYGMRTHPLSGRREMHKGIDFAGKHGGPVIAVAKGVVTYAGKRWGYGQVIDIAHGNGYTTRYAHNSRLLVSVGDTVEKGFQIAEIGSSGRSTGPHVHFEVLKDGREINPVKFIRAAK